MSLHMSLRRILRSFGWQEDLVVMGSPRAPHGSGKSSPGLERVPRVTLAGPRVGPQPLVVLIIGTEMGSTTPLPTRPLTRAFAGSKTLLIPSPCPPLTDVPSGTDNPSVLAHASGTFSCLVFLGRSPSSTLPNFRRRRLVFHGVSAYLG